MKPYYEHAGITIYHGDCRDVLPVLEGVDAVVTDPPYNYGKKYGVHNDSMPRADYEAWCAEWFALCRVLAKRVVVFPGSGNLDVWFKVAKPSAVGVWYKPGNAGSSIIGWNEWEPWLYWCGDKGLLGGSDVLKASVGKQQDTGDHPCPKPISIMRKLLKKLRAGSIIDPFMGSGTTLIAAKAMSISAVGIEIEERFCETAAQRLSQEVLDLGAA